MSSTSKTSPKRKNYKALAEKYARQLEVLEEINQIIGSKEQTETVLTAALHHLLHTLNYSAGQIYRLSPTGSDLWLYLELGSGSKPVTPNDDIFSIDEKNIISDAARTRETIYVPDIEKGPYSYYHQDNAKAQIKSDLAVPLQYGHPPQQELLGVLRVQSNQADAFNQADIKFFSSLAGLFASTIKNTQAVKQLENDLQEIKILYNLQRQEDLSKHVLKGLSTSGYEYDGTTILPTEQLTPAAKLVIAQKQDKTNTVETKDGKELLAPIKLHGETIGVLGIEDDAETQWADEDLKLVDEICSQVGLAIESTRLLQETQKRTKELSILFESSRQLSETIDLQRIYQILNHQIINYFNADVASVSLLNPARTHFEALVRQYRNNNDEIIDDPRPWVDSVEDFTPLQLILKQPDMIIEHLDDPDLAPGVKRHLEKRADKKIHTLAILPIVVRNNLLGILQICHFVHRHNYTENELQLAQAIISQVTVAIENAQLFARTEDTLAETQKLYMVSRALVESATLEETFDAVLETIKTYGVDRVSISLLDWTQTGDLDTVTIVASWDRESEKILPVGSKISGNMFSLVNTFAQPPFHPLISEDLSLPGEQDERMDDAFRMFMYEGLGAVTMFSTPMFLGSEYKGVLSISTRKPHTYSEQEVRLYQTLADQTIVAIENHRLFEAVRHERDQAALLYKIGQTLSRAASINQVQETILDLTEKIGAAHSEIYVTEGRKFISAASNLPERQKLSAEETAKLARIVLSKGVEAQAIEQKKTVMSHRGQKMWGIAGIPDPKGMKSAVSTPFYSQRSKLRGTLTFFSPEEEGFNEDQISLIESVAIQTAAALENVWLLQQTANALKETEVLYKATEDFNRAQHPQELLTILAESMSPEGQEANIDYMSLAVISALADDGSPEKMDILAEWDTQAEANIWTDVLNVPITAKDYTFIPKLSAREHQTFYYKDLDKETQASIETYIGKVRSILAIPLSVGRNWLGTLFVASHTDNFEFDSNLISRAATLSGQVAVVIQNLQLAEETQQNLFYSEILSNLSQELLTADNVDIIYQLSLDAISATEPGRGAAIFMYDEIEMGVELEMVAMWDNPFTPEGIDGWPAVAPGARFSTEELGLEALLKTGQTVVSANAVEDESFSNILRQLLTMMQISGLVAVPIWLNREVNGFILIGNYQPVTFSSELVRLYADIARQTSVALENYRLLGEARHRATLLQTAAEVSQAATGYLDMDTLLSQSINLIRDRFGYYHASIFLIDEYRKFAVVKASTGEVGRKMLAMSHKLEVGGRSIVGTSTGTGKPRIALDVGEDAVHFNNPLLPNTRSEMALPLIARGQVIGAVDVQSTKQGAFTESDITILQSMANQLANAIEAARSFQDSQHALDEVRKLHEYYLREQWGAFLKEQKATTSYRLTEEGIIETSETAWWPEIDQAIESNQPIVVSPPLNYADNGDSKAKKSSKDKNNGSRQKDNNAASLIAPLSLQNDVVIGALDFELLNKDVIWEEDNLKIIEAVTAQATQAIEAARLFEQTQAAREEAESLYHVSRTLVAATNEQQMFHAVLEKLLSTLGLKQGGILFFEEDRKYGKLFALFEDGKPVEPGLCFPIEGNPSYDKLIETKQPLAIEDIATDPLVETVRDLNLERGIVSLLLVPIIIKDEVVGAMGADAVGEKHVFTESEINLARAMADQLSIMLQNYRLLQETNHRAIQLQTSADVGRVATSNLNQDVMLGEAVELIRDRFGFYHVQVFLINEAEQAAVLHKSTGVIGQKLLSMGHKVIIEAPNVVGQAAKQRQPIVVRDLSHPQDDNKMDIPQLHKEYLSDTEAELAIPLQVGDTLIGVLDVHSTSPSAFTKEDIATMEILAAQLAIAVRNAQAFREQQETAERLKEIDKLKTQFLANMSHELRTPLNSIIGFSRVILKGIDGPLTDLQKADLTSIHNSGQHLLSLINNMLDLSKIEAGKMELNVEEIEIDPIIKSVMSTAKALVKDKSVELVQEIPESLGVISADPTRIRQIVLNLVSNACKFTDEGNVTLRAYQDDEKLTISVTDTGIGIPEEKLENIFEEFTQVDASTTRKVGGTGLGLPISRHFVEMHKGHIWVESTLGQGSTFSFSIPMMQAEEGLEEEPEPDLAMSEELVNHDGQGQVIVAIDDDPNVVNLYQRFLEKQGYKVIGIHSSKDVIPEIKQHQPSAILLDVLMPEKDGWGVLRELKGNDVTKDIPVVICSIISDKNRGFSLGAADYLTKPIVESELVSALKHLERQDKEQVKVLVIDDEADDILLIRRILEAQPNYVILEARNGKEGLELVENQNPDLIILDLTMPEVDGFTVVEQLKNKERTRGIPIIIVSAKELTSSEHKFLTGQVEVLLQKGLFSENELLEDVGQALKQIHQNTEIS